MWGFLGVFWGWVFLGGGGGGVCFGVRFFCFGFLVVGFFNYFFFFTHTTDKCLSYIYKRQVLEADQAKTCLRLICLVAIAPLDKTVTKSPNFSARRKGTLK